MTARTREEQVAALKAELLSTQMQHKALGHAIARLEAGQRASEEAIDAGHEPHPVARG